MKNVGLIGVGIMGKLIVPRIRDAGHKLYIYDVSQDALLKVAGRGVDAAASTAEVASKADIILMSLPGPKQVEEVVNGRKGLLTKAHSGMVLIDLSTVDPRTTQSMAAAAAQKEVGYLDAPVLGRPASVGEWSLPVGGDAADLAKCIDILKLFARNVFHIGPAGSGNKIKLLNQMMFSAINSMTAEMMAVAGQVGIEPKLLYETISASQAATVSGLFKELGKRIATSDYDNPTFQIDLLVKDVSLAIAMAQDSGAVPLLTKFTQQMNEQAQSSGLGKKDTSEMWKVRREENTRN
jgi:3-hydroxyisobutyrate dehydrogenase